MSGDGRRAVVIGLARSGMALARTLDAEGWRVLVTDRGDDGLLRARAAQLPPTVSVQLGGYDESVVEGAAMLCPSPGVPWDSAELELARRLGIPIRSEIALVFERCRGRVIGITGTNGKTTTTSLVADIMRRGDVPVHVGGNIGTPLLDRLDSVGEHDWVVLELSSFQLETVEAPRCVVGCVLNVTPDHLDRHGSFEHYGALKERVARYAGDTAVLGYDDVTTRAMAARVSARLRWFGRSLGTDGGATVRGGQIVSVEAAGEQPVMGLRDIPLFGAHNVLNVLAAVAVTRAAGMSTQQIAEGVRSFHAVPHRLQAVSESGGVLWINDSKATNVDSAVVGLRAFEGRPLVWIGGGQRSTVRLEPLAREVAAHARAAVLTGEMAGDLDGALREHGVASRFTADTLAAAVDIAAGIAREGDVVLFSPGFKSFDRFRDFEHRGEEFMRLVRQSVAPGGQG